MRRYVREFAPHKAEGIVEAGDAAAGLVVALAVLALMVALALGAIDTGANLGWPVSFEKVDRLLGVFI